MCKDIIAELSRITIQDNISLVLNQAIFNVFIHLHTPV